AGPAAAQACRPRAALSGGPARVAGGGDPRLLGRHGAQPEPQGGHPTAARPAVPGPDEHGGTPVSDPGELIGGALRDLPDQAVTGPPAADAIWRAEQRRRRRTVMAISATAPGAAAAAAVLAFTLGGGGAPAGHGGSVGRATGRLALSTPI